MDNQMDEEKGLEFVQFSEQDATGDLALMDSFRPAAHMGASELELRQISPKTHKSKPPVSVFQSTRSRSRVSAHGRPGAKYIQSRTSLSVPAAKISSMNLLEAKEFEMELLNILRERDFYIMKKHEEHGRRRSVLNYQPGQQEFMPEQISRLSPDAEIRTIRRPPWTIVHTDHLDVSIHPSYTKVEIPYHTKCLQRIRASKQKYEMQFRHELEMLQKSQRSAYDAARFSQFLGPEALQRVNYSPRGVKITPKERQRINYLLREVQR